MSILWYFAIWCNATKDNFKYPFCQKNLKYENITERAFLQKQKIATKKNSSLRKEQVIGKELCLHCATVGCSATCSYTRYLRR